MRLLFILLLVFGLEFICAEEQNKNSTSLDDVIHPKDRNTVQTRIINGKEVQKHQYPFAVVLIVTIQGKQYLCGGTLLTNSVVLTAAHCVEDASDVIVRLGVHAFNDNTNVIQKTTKKYLIHENYDADKYLNDIALIKLMENITFNDYVKPVKLVEPTSDTFVGERAIVLGWGLTETGNQASALKYVDVTVMSNAACKAIEAFRPYVVDSQVCTSGVGIVGSCGGDSGGPLMFGDVQIGIVSYGPTNCLLGLPSAFSRVTSYLSWIEDNVGKIDNSATSSLGSFLVILVALCTFII